MLTVRLNVYAECRRITMQVKVEFSRVVVVVCICGDDHSNLTLILQI